MPAQGIGHCVVILSITPALASTSISDRSCESPTSAQGEAEAGDANITQSKQPPNMHTVQIAARCLANKELNLNYPLPVCRQNLLITPCTSSEPMEHSAS